MVPRVAAERPKHRTTRIEEVERGPNVLVGAMPLEIDEKHVVPHLLSTRTRLDAREVDAVVVEHLEHTTQRAALVTHREGNRRLVSPGRRRIRGAELDEARHVVGNVLHALAYYSEPIQLGREGTPDCRAI